MMKRDDLIREVRILARVAVYMGSRIKDPGRRLFTFAESCSGGLLASCVASVPGASESFPGSLVTYSNEAKIEKLSVRPSTLEKYGAVSGQCAVEMARGVLGSFAARLAVSVTGIAGPGGGSDEKPVGTVWFSLAREGGVVNVARGFFPGRPRRIVQLHAARSALRLLIRGLCEIQCGGVSIDGQKKGSGNY
jgi:PncC family amidohydrolase